MSGDNLPTILTEMDAIEADMRTDRTAYNADVGKQERYRALARRKHEMTTGGGDTLLGATQEAMAVPSLSEWTAQTGSSAGYSEFLNICRSLNDVFCSTPAADRDALVSSFEALPDEVAGIAAMELLNKSRAAGLATGDQVDAFSEEPDGAVLVREWGGAASQKLGLVRRRIERVVEQLDDNDIPAFVGWLQNLSIGASIALYRRLAA